MNFLNSFLLWTAAGASLPFLIHMLNREKPKRIVIPTVKFIIKAVEKSSGSRKLNNFLLLLVRMLILIFISLIIARPQIAKFMSTESNDSFQAIIIIDNSFYTAHNSGGDNQLTEIKSKAKEIINSLPNGSKICILSVDESGSEFTEIKTYALDKIDQITTSSELIDTRSMISAAADLFSTSPKNTQRIYVVSDMNIGSWQGSYQIPGISPEMVYLTQVQPRRGNLFISNVSIRSEGINGSQRIYARRSLQILSEIHGDRSLSGIKVTLKINNEVVDDKTLTTDETFAEVGFSTVFEESGTYFCEVSIESHDGIIDDNHYYFTVNVRPPARVYTINDIQNNNHLYIKAALAPSGWHGHQKYDVQQLNYTEITNKLAESKPELIILCGSMALSEIDWNLLKVYTEQGGTLIMCPDENTGYKELNQGALALLQGKISPIEGKFNILRSSQSLFAKKLELESLKDVVVSNASSFEEEPTGNKIEVAMRFSNNKAGLLIRQMGQGEAVFWGLSPHQKSSNFLSSDSFALIWHLIAERFATGVDFECNYSCSAVADTQALKAEISNYKIQSPTGTVDKLPLDSFELTPEGHYSSSYAQTLLPGHYLCSSAIYGGFSCNIERSNSYYQYPPTHEFKHLVHTEDTAKTLNPANALFSPNGLLTVLIFGTLLLMVFEVHLGNRTHYAGN
jgi:hypothetical protein